jgi:type II secretory pathway pseudopilin PulG
MNKEQGLTIIELLITIAILVATVTTILALGNRAVSNAGFFSTQTQAVFLAKEAMEILEDEDARKNIMEAGEGISYWRLDYANDPEETNIGNCYSKLKLHPVKGFYKVGSHPGTETIFSRCIIANKNGEEVKIETNVVFDYQNINHSITLHRIFYD